MPAQTTYTEYISFPDGAKVSIKADGDGGYTDIGALGSDATGTLNYTENEYVTANAGKLQKQIRDMVLEGSFTLINLNPSNIAKFGGGLFTETTTAAAPNSSIPDQVIAAGWSAGAVYALDLLTSSTDSTKLKLSAAPTITSVTLDAAGTPEVLSSGTDFLVVEHDCVSGYGITFQTAGIAKPSPTTYAITIDYGTNTPVARTTLSCGSSTAVLAAYALKIEHTDSNGLVRGMEIYSADTVSGGFQFSWKSAASDGVEEMPLSFKAKIDTNRTDGRQLLSYYRDNGAA